MAVNQVCLAGHLTRDAALRATRSQTPVLNFTIAVNERRRGEGGDWEDVPVFVPCVIFGTRAEKLAQHLAKGTKVTVSGRLHLVSYLKDDEQRSYLEVVVSDLEFLSRKDEVAGGMPYSGIASRQPELYDEDVAF